jgi:hypothetical protein
MPDETLDKNPYPEYGLGRIPRVDTRSAAYAVQGGGPDLSTLPVRRSWRLRWKGNQGRTSQCVGYALTGLLRSAPEVHTHLAPAQVYVGAQKDDEWEGENYEGSSVLGGLRYLHKITDMIGTPMPEIVSYHAIYTIPDLIRWLALKGPVAVGTDWKTTMFEPGPSNILDCSGGNVGGHAYLIYGYDRSKRLFKILNSWGENWGSRGTAWIRFDDFDALLQSGGEAWGVEKYEFKQGHIPGRKGQGGVEG